MQRCCAADREGRGERRLTAANLMPGAGGTRPGLAIPSLVGVEDRSAGLEVIRWPVHRAVRIRREHLTRGPIHHVHEPVRSGRIISCGVGHPTAGPAGCSFIPSKSCSSCGVHDTPTGLPVSRPGQDGRCPLLSQDAGPGSRIRIGGAVEDRVHIAVVGDPSPTAPPPIRHWSPDQLVTPRWEPIGSIEGPEPAADENILVGTGL